MARNAPYLIHGVNAGFVRGRDGGGAFRAGGLSCLHGLWPGLVYCGGGSSPFGLGLGLGQGFAFDLELACGLCTGSRAGWFESTGWLLVDEMYLIQSPGLVPGGLG